MLLISKKVVMFFRESGSWHVSHNNWPIEARFKTDSCAASKHRRILNWLILSVSSIYAALISVLATLTFVPLRVETKKEMDYSKPFAVLLFLFLVHESLSSPVPFRMGSGSTKPYLNELYSRVERATFEKALDLIKQQLHGSPAPTPLVKIKGLSVLKQYFYDMGYMNYSSSLFTDEWGNEIINTSYHTTVPWVSSLVIIAWLQYCLLVW